MASSKRIALALVGMLGVAAPAQAGDDAEINAQITGSRAVSDVTIHPTWRPSTTKVFIGECGGFRSGKRTRVRISGSRYDSDFEAKIVD